MDGTGGLDAIRSSVTDGAPPHARGELGGRTTIAITVDGVRIVPSAPHGLESAVLSKSVPRRRAACRFVSSSTCA